MTREDNEIQKQIRERVIRGNHDGFSSGKREVREAQKKIDRFNHDLYLGLLIIFIIITYINFFM